MKFSTNWLREIVELPASTDELAELLTLAGVEIEGVENRGAAFENVVVAQIISSSAHPNADRLSVCQVDDGSGQPRQIVCGAKNYQPGDKVPLASPGAVLPCDLKIRASKLRGVDSQGMLCSAKELLLAEDSSGLLILPVDAKIGVPIGSLYPTDTILDVEITPNRADLLSHFGLAREIAALTRKPSPPAPTFLTPFAENSETVRIIASNECPFYSARRIENVTVGPSPDWLRSKLESAGIRSINNVVDITNFVMLELGQPLHAFDADKLQGGITVRLAQPDEKFLALDGRTYSLGAENLVIADATRAIAIAGVMGGEETGVTAATRNLLLESAYFLPSSVRRTARTLNVASDSSYRFERGVDPGMVLPASSRAADLILELAGGTLAPEVSIAGAVPLPPGDVKFRYARCQQLLGVRINEETVDAILDGFGLQKIESNESESTWKIPSHRGDLRREADLIEEVVRVYGIDKIPGTDRSRFTAASAADGRYEADAKLRGRLTAAGFSEVRTSALIPRDLTETAFGGAAVEVRNPLSQDHVALRPSLVPGLLAVVARNLRLGAETVRLFELGRVFAPPVGNESRSLGLISCGKVQGVRHWRETEKRSLDLFDIKGAIEALGLADVSFQRTERAGLALALEIRSESELIGFAGQLAQAETARLGSTAPIILAELSLDSLTQVDGETRTFRELEKFPAVTRDIALLVPDTLAHSEILATIEAAREPLLARVELFDLFAGTASAEGSAQPRSLAYSLTYRAKDRTLTADEVNVVHARIRARLQKELPVELRE